MRFETSQQMRLGQHMKLAPRMIQSMEILQMPLLALQERIEQELESNIALEQVTPGSEDGSSDNGEHDGEVLRERESVLDAGNDVDDFSRLNEFENSYREAAENQFSDEGYRPTAPVGDRDRKMDAMANTAARGEGLTEQLLHQWAFVDAPEDVVEAGKLLIQYIDEDGFLTQDLEAILEQKANVPGVDLTLELLEEALAEIQSNLEPPGIGARNHQECLLLQIDRISSESDDGEDWSDAVTLIAHHYDDLLQNRLPRIEQKANISIERIRDAMQLMKRLHLHPGRELVSEDVPPVIPDVIVEYEEASDSYVARLADGVLPLLRISDDAEAISKDRNLDKEAREFAQNGIRNATWLIDAINQRSNTLLRVVNVVLSRQRDWFDYGEQHLKPLPMTEVADQLGVHVATVSRAVADKWMMTPRGVVPLRGFFTGGATTESGEAMSWDAIKAKLKEIVDAEDKRKPLSDESIARELKKQGIEIARRTVVKYRQQLDIPPARLRKVH